MKTPGTEIIHPRRLYRQLFFGNPLFKVAAHRSQQAQAFLRHLGRLLVDGVGRFKVQVAAVANLLHAAQEAFPIQRAGVCLLYTSRFRAAP